MPQPPAAAMLPRAPPRRYARYAMQLTLYAAWFD